MVYSDDLQLHMFSFLKTLLDRKKAPRLGEDEMLAYVIKAMSRNPHLIKNISNATPMMFSFCGKTFTMDSDGDNLVISCLSGKYRYSSQNLGCADAVRAVNEYMIDYQRSQSRELQAKELASYYNLVKNLENKE